MARRIGSANKGGRPPLNRDRHQYNPGIDLRALAVLREQAAQCAVYGGPARDRSPEYVGVSLSVYVELLVTGALGMTGEYLPESVVLPTRMPMEEIRERTDARTRAQCPAPSRASHRIGVRVDRPVATEITRRCLEIDDVDWSSYLRAILYDAAGLDMSAPAAEQLSADLDWEEGALTRTA